MRLKRLVSVIFFFFFYSTSYSNTISTLQYPVGPDANLTPGSLCKNASQRRYQEQIPYCARNVSSEKKNEIITNYVENFGYTINKANRSAFKIDHFIPLCMGGSNEQDNLWPQHKTVYEITDPIEHLACIKMNQGVLLQADAVELIRRSKLDLNQADDVMNTLNSLGLSNSYFPFADLNNSIAIFR